MEYSNEKKNVNRKMLMILEITMNSLALDMGMGNAYSTFDNNLWSSKSKANHKWQNQNLIMCCMIRIWNRISSHPGVHHSTNYKPRTIHQYNNQIETKLEIVFGVENETWKKCSFFCRFLFLNQQHMTNFYIFFFVPSFINFGIINSNNSFI